MLVPSKKILTGALALAAAALLAGLLGCGSSAKPEQPKQTAVKQVGIVQLVEHEALDAAAKGFVEGLARNGFVEGKNVSFDRHNAQADQSNLQNIAHRFVNNKVDLICAIATPAAQAMANATGEISIVATAVTDYKVAKLVKDVAKPGTNVTGTTDMNPVAEQLDLLLRIVPQAKTVGLIYCSSEVNSQLQAELMKAAAAKKQVAVKEATVSSVNDIQQAARSLVGQVDAVYVPTDNVLASAMPTLAMVTREAKLPVICGEAGMVRAGGLATLGIDYYRLGVQTGEMAAAILAGKAKPAEMAIQAQKDFKVTINGKEAKLLGLQLPEALTKEADMVE